MNHASNKTRVVRRDPQPNRSVSRMIACATVRVAAATGGCALAVTGLYALAAYTHPAPALSLAGLAAIYTAYIAALRLALGPRERPQQRRARPGRRAKPSSRPMADESQVDTDGDQRCREGEGEQLRS